MGRPISAPTPPRSSTQWRAPEEETASPEKAREGRETRRATSTPTINLLNTVEGLGAAVGKVERTRRMKVAAVRRGAAWNSSW